MKRLIVLCGVAAVTAFAAPNVTPELAAHLETVGPGELVRVLVVMETQLPQAKLMALTEGLTRDERRVVVEQELSRFAEASQREVLAYMENRAAGGHAADVMPLWIVNAVAARADRDTVEAVSALPGVAYVHWDKEVPVELLQDVVPAVEDEIAWNVTKIQAPEVWNAGYNGTGIVVCVADGGVNYNHLDLAGHMWTKAGYPNHGRNFDGGDPNNTMDYDGHGTHVAGTVASDGTAGSQCGMAPKAQIMIAKLGSASSTWFAAWQWAITEGVDVITSSWSKKYPNYPAYYLHRQASEKTLAAGVFHTNSIGNQGNQLPSYPIPFNIATPGNCPPPWLHPDQTLREGISGTVGVGATDSGDNLAYFSGRGPASWDQHRHANNAPYDDYHWSPGLGLIKPDFVAPGVSIKSCSYSNPSGYAVMSGTSMSTPCAAGAVALLLDYNDALPPAQIERALELTADPLPGQTKGTKVNDNGAGRINVYAALQFLQNTTGVDLKYFRAAGLDDGVRLAWDCENGTYAGFNLYREVEGGAPGAGRERVNAELVTGRAPFAYEDRGVATGVTYDYWLEAVPASGAAQTYGPASATPGLKVAYGFALEPSYPNPATSEARIAFSLPLGVTGEYEVAIFDVAGRKVRTVAAGASAAGRNEVTWNLADDAGRKVAPGVYLYRLTASCGSAVHRAVVMP